MKIDSVSIRMTAGYNIVSTSDWQRMAADDRFDLVRSKRVVFFAGDTPVPVRDALNWLAAAGPC